MADPPIGGSFRALLTIIAVKILTQRYLRQFWKHPGGVFFLSRFCIKRSPFENLIEAHTVRFLSQHTSIPVPKVYCAFTYRGQAYTVMERIDGARAGQGWVRRSAESKEKILDQLRSIVEKIRAVSPPDGVGVSNLLGGPIYDGRLSGEPLRGPFSTVEDFHKSLRDGMELDDHYNVLPSDLQELVTFHKQTFSRPVLTHGDLSSLNVLVRGDKVVGIIDWDTSGWFPPYWEYTCAYNVNPYNEFWRQEVDKFLTPMQYALEMENIRRKYFGDF
ncbi:kinase-like domain-containing protein [Biscogniauxia marginata]|nr:kinase-like domain-containing protein [Biscogniauxia marginata]